MNGCRRELSSNPRLEPIIDYAILFRYVTTAQRHAVRDVQKISRRKIWPDQMWSLPRMASTCSRKVRLCLYEDRLREPSISLQKFEQHRPDYLALNPNGVVPTLVHRDRPIIAILGHHRISRRRLPGGAAEAGRSYARADAAVAEIFRRGRLQGGLCTDLAVPARKRAEAGLSEEARRVTLAAIPTAERREREKMAQGGFTLEELESLPQMRKCLTDVERAAAQGPLARRSELFPGRYRDPSFIDRIRNLRPEF